MKFGPVPLASAEGAILAHSLNVLVDGQPKRLPKGTVLKPEDIVRLNAAGLTTVVVAQLQTSDLSENLAAEQVAKAMTKGTLDGLSIDAASTGRVNLRAAIPGLIDLDAERIDAANRINPHITIATVPHLMRLDRRGLAATIKIITYGVPRADVEAVKRCIQGAIRLRSAKINSASLIETTVDGGTTSDKGRRATQRRLSRLGVHLTPRVLVDHDETALASALGAAGSDLILILTGSATSDPRDTAPAALVTAGGVLSHYGMPVDPGNLLFLGELDGTPVIGLPGCARSPALNGADWVLERVVCGIPVSSDDIAAMGVGGLLKEIPSRPRPRET